MSSASSDEDDGDYVPTEGTSPARSRRTRMHAATDAVCAVIAGAASDADELQPLVRADTKVSAEAAEAAPGRVNELWRDINASTGVSQRAADKSAKVSDALRALSLLVPPSWLILH